MTNFGDIPGNERIPEDAMALGAVGSAKGSFSAYRSAALSIASGATLVFDAEEWDASGWYATGTGIFTPTVPGYYRLSAMVSTVAPLPADKAVTLDLFKNGAIIKRLAHLEVGTTQDQAIHIGGSALVSSDGDDTFLIKVLHDVTSPSPDLELIAAPWATYFQGELVGRQ